mmetsp:Transcript_21568/g.51111  ORF Transcript_21568/g.51111 Transcript_21568/m.51111 type:complete len:346 (-) Transcript_21568:583-1620(-)
MIFSLAPSMSAAWRLTLLWSVLVPWPWLAARSQQRTPFILRRALTMPDMERFSRCSLGVMPFLRRKVVTSLTTGRHTMSGTRSTAVWPFSLRWNRVPTCSSEHSPSIRGRMAVFLDSCSSRANVHSISRLSTHWWFSVMLQNRVMAAVEMRGVTTRLLSMATMNSSTKLTPRSRRYLSRNTSTRSLFLSTSRDRVKNSADVSGESKLFQRYEKNTWYPDSSNPDGGNHGWNCSVESPVPSKRRTRALRPASPRCLRRPALPSRSQRDSPCSKPAGENLPPVLICTAKVARRRGMQRWRTVEVIPLSSWRTISGLLVAMSTRIHPGAASCVIENSWSPNDISTRRR